MKKWAIIFLLIPALAFGFLQSDPDVGTGSAVASGSYTGSVAIYHNCNALSTAYNIGSGTLTFPAGASAVNGEWYIEQSDWDDLVCPLTSLSDTDTFRIGFYFTFENNVGTEQYTRFLRIPSDGSQFKMLIYNTGQVNFILGDNASYILSSSDLDDESKHFVELAFNDTNNTLHVYIDGSELGNLTYASIDLSAVTDAYFGSGDTYPGWFYIDQFMVSDDDTENLFDVKDKTDF